MPIRDRADLEYDLISLKQGLSKAQDLAKQAHDAGSVDLFKEATVEVERYERGIERLNKNMERLNLSTKGVAKSTTDWTQDSVLARSALLQMVQTMESELSKLQNLQRAHNEYILTLDKSVRMYASTAAGMNANVAQLESLRKQMNLTRADAAKMADSLQGALARGMDRNQIVQFQKQLQSVYGVQAGNALLQKGLEKNATRPGFLLEASRGSERAYAMAGQDQEAKQIISALSRTIQSSRGSEAVEKEQEGQKVSVITDNFITSLTDKFNSAVSGVNSLSSKIGVPVSGAGLLGVASAATSGYKFFQIFGEMNRHLSSMERSLNSIAGQGLGGGGLFGNTAGSGGRRPGAQRKRGFGNKYTNTGGFLKGRLLRKFGMVGQGSGVQAISGFSGTAGRAARGFGSLTSRVVPIAGKLAGGALKLGKIASIGGILGLGGEVVGDAIASSTQEGSWANWGGKALSAGSGIAGWAGTGAAVGAFGGPVLSAILGLAGAGWGAYRHFSGGIAPGAESKQDTDITMDFANEILQNTKQGLQEALTQVEDEFAGYSRSYAKTTVDFYDAIGNLNSSASREAYGKFIKEAEAASDSVIAQLSDMAEDIDAKLVALAQAGKTDSDEYRKLQSAKMELGRGVQEEEIKKVKARQFGTQYQRLESGFSLKRELIQANLQESQSEAELAKLIGKPFDAIVIEARARSEAAKSEIEVLNESLKAASAIQITGESPEERARNRTEKENRLSDINSKLAQQRVIILKAQLQTTAELFQAINDLPDIQLSRAQIEGVQGRREVAGAIGGLTAANARRLGKEEADLAQAEFNTRREETKRIKEQAQREIRNIEADQSLSPEQRGAAIKSQQAIIQKADNDVLRSEAAALKARKQEALEGLQIERSIMDMRRETLETEKGTADYLGASYSQIYDIQKGIVSAAQEQRQNTLNQMQEMERLGAAANDPEYVKLQAQYARETADIMKASMSAQRDFLDKALGKAFGVGQGSRFQPLVNTRMLLGGNYRQTESGLQIADGPRTLSQGSFEAQGTASRRLGTGTTQKPKMAIDGQITLKLDANQDGIVVALKQKFLEATSVSGMA